MQAKLSVAVVSFSVLVFGLACSFLEEEFSPIFAELSPTTTPSPIPTATPFILPDWTPTPVYTPWPTPTLVPDHFSLSIIARNEQARANIAEKPDLDERTMEQRIHAMVNGQRAVHKVHQLEWNEVLAMLARVHSEDMADNDYMSHINLEGEGPKARGERLLGLSCYRETATYVIMGISENIYHLNQTWKSYTTRSDIRIYTWLTPGKLAQMTLDAWLDSPTHKKVMLNPSYIKAGIGVHIAEDGRVYVTQNFC